MITTDVIELAVSAELVVADLTDSNPNVMYELGIRHTAGKPTIHLYQWDSVLPFDVAQQRAIKYKLEDPDSVEDARQRVIKQMRSLQANPKDFDNPVSRTFSLAALHESENPTEQWAATVVDEIQTLRSVLEEELHALRTSFGPRGASPYLLDAVQRTASARSNHLSGVFDDLVASLQGNEPIVKLLAAIERMRSGPLDPVEVSAIDELLRRSGPDDWTSAEYLRIYSKANELYELSVSHMLDPDPAPNDGDPDWEHI